MRLPAFLRAFGAGALLWAAGPARGVESAPPVQADVLVYGATPGGFCAAVAAAREGAKVVLLEPGEHVGGLNTGGLSSSDSHLAVRSTLRGLFAEWHRRIAADYAARGVKLPYDVTAADEAVWTYEPHVASRVTRAMLAEAGVVVVTGQPLTGVEKDGARITLLTTAGGRHAARVFIDATYEGDLMAKAGVYWRMGRESRGEYDEPLAGRQYPRPKLAIDGFDAKGFPLPLISSITPGQDQAGERSVMAYGFRLCVTTDPANRVPFPEPKQYDPARFELVRRYFARYPDAPSPWELRPLPGGKFDVDHPAGAMFTLELLGEAMPWCDADAAGRAALWEKHRQYTLEFYRFLTTDPAVPEKIRSSLSALGLCRDEFTATQHWPAQLYVREGRRMTGRLTLTEKDIFVEPTKEDPVAVCSFPVEAYDCRRIALPDGVVNEGAIFPVRMPGRAHGHPYQVPYRAITPAADECVNLLVPVALSATHVAYSSLRMEPNWMTLGQSAGIAAALAGRDGVSVQELPYAKLRERLRAQDVVLDLPKLPPALAPSR